MTGSARSPFRAADGIRVALALMLLSFIGCVSVDVDASGPAQIAQSYVGKPLAELESELGPPQRENMTNGETLSSWNFGRCSVTARTNADGIVKDVTWSSGCGLAG